MTIGFSPSLDDLVRVLCSTPYGIKGLITKWEVMRSRNLPSAQRLTASKV